MSEFREGQEVEVAPLSEMFGAWRKAKIIRRYWETTQGEINRRSPWMVEFPNRTRAVFPADAIRPAKTNDAAS